MCHEEITGLNIHVRGIVQGVGFRPFVYQVAVKNGLSGWVCNSSRGVEIEVVGSPESLRNFMDELQNNPPPLSRIDDIQTTICSVTSYTQFSIIESQSNPSGFIPISSDISICQDCLDELFNPQNRRYRYPFINCTNCGPRFSIIQNIPYDRPYTTMSEFPMCDDCRKEYENPLDRRFHAQPVACEKCGPELTYISHEGKEILSNEGAIFEARKAIKNGLILAIKGLGGFHLACDATNREAVEQLRERKHRIDKPFALMASSIDCISPYCEISDEERQLIKSRQRPIVLLQKKPECTLPLALAPGQKTLGFMLPYTPMHYLLMEEASDFPGVLVMTSGNMSEEPIAYEDKDALERLTPLCDGYLTHNRGIHMRVDDSVMRVIDGSPVFMRRSRGFAPDPIHMPFAAPQVLATGAELKNHITLTRDSYAFHSHYIGDLENFETYRSFEQAIGHFENLFRVKPEIIACDLHPNYLSTRYAVQRSEKDSIPLVYVQHHHAHLAACLVDNGWKSDDPVIGLSFDGTGYGTDETIWGGEVLIGGYNGYHRRFHLETFPLPGGEKAVKNPARVALALLSACQNDFDPSLSPVKYFSLEELGVIQTQIDRQINTPLTSSMGRLFDGIASMAGVRHHVSYEGQAAIEFEALADSSEQRAYMFGINGNLIDFKPVVNAVLEDIHNSISVEKISARFHTGVANLCLNICSQCKDETGISTVAISGGVWQNTYLFCLARELLLKSGFTVLYHQKVPTNDACISLGQAAIAARMKH